MAIQADLATDYGTIPGAYIRVVSFSGDKTAISFTADGYVNQAAREVGMKPLISVSYRMDYPTANLIAAAYELLKSTDFPGAVDC